MKRIFMVAVLMLGIALVAVACGDDDDDDANGTTATEATAEAGTIVDVASEGGFTTLVTAVEAADLTETLSGEGPFTVFAPTDEAFAALPEGTLDALLEDPDALGDVLTYHVVSGDVKAADVVELDSAETVQGQSIDIAVEDGVVTLNGAATVTQTDIEASNGTIHVIDAVLTPPAG
jgi:uncharacterized surface protein with fasciclin (FAS1) repeats